MTDIHKQAEAYAARIIPADHTGLADPTSWEEQRIRFALCYLAGATAQQGGGMKWVKASDKPKETKMYIVRHISGHVSRILYKVEGGPINEVWDNFGVHEYLDETPASQDEQLRADLELMERREVAWSQRLKQVEDMLKESSEKLRVAVSYLQKIAQMSDPGSMIKAVTDMKGLATEALAKINTVKP